MSYTDFIGYINQWNVLPGSYNTLSKWKVFAGVSEKSRILEVACTTGFSSRELAVISNCTGIGIDISENSILSAQKNKDLYAPPINIDYRVADAESFNDGSKYTHIIFGSSLGFFDNPRKMINHAVSLLEEDGCILASPFYTIRDIPDHLVQKAKQVFGITVTRESYKDIMSLYSDFEILFEERNVLIPETQQELDHYCKSTLAKSEKEGLVFSFDEYQIAFDRLMEIKKMSNELREYQGYSVLVLRYRKHTYKNRFVELF